MVKRLLLVCILVLAAMPSVSPARTPTLAQAWERTLADAARRAGVDPAAFLRSEQVAEVMLGDGTTVVQRASVREWIRRIAGTAVPAEAGVGGTPEITAGDFSHGYLNVALNAPLSYNVTSSAVVPATPGVFLPPPATTLFYEAGGPLYQVKGTYDGGLHTVGTGLGSNVDTAESGPYLPFLSGGAVADSKIDFVGHVAILTQFRLCYIICIASVGAIVGDGVVIWDWSARSLPSLP